MMIVTYFSVTMIIIDQKIRLSDAVDVEPVGDQRVVAGEGLAEGVDRRGADIAEDDADRADRELVERALGVAVRAVMPAGLASAPPVAVMLMREVQPGQTANAHSFCPRAALRGGAPN